MEEELKQRIEKLESEVFLLKQQVMLLLSVPKLDAILGLDGGKFPLPTRVRYEY